MSDLKKENAVDYLALGSWHIYNRQTLDESVAFVSAALDRGINHFDIADYWDYTFKNTERFKEVMKIIGRPREDYHIGLKIFTNSEKSREQIIREFLGNLGLDYADCVLCSRPAPGESLEDAVVAMDGLVASGLTKELDLSLWDAPQLSQAYQLMQEKGLHTPKFVQFQYNICRRDVLESEAYTKLFAETGLKFQAAFPLEGGIIAGHIMRRRYNHGEEHSGSWFHPEDRNLARDSGGIRDEIIRRVPRMIEVSRELGLTPAQLSLAFISTNPNLENILFGATKIWQIDEAIAGVEYGLANPEKIREAAEEFHVYGAAAPKLFDFATSTEK